MKPSFLALFEAPRPIIGMVHVPALPGTPRHVLPVEQIIERAPNDALALKNGGVHGLIVENMHDVPYLNRNVGPEITAIMSVVGNEVRRQTGIPCGIQILAGANESALAAALASGMQYVRAEGFLYGHIADEGYMDADAPTLLRKRKNLGAEGIFILTDIKKKHASHSVTADIDLLTTARSAAFLGSDGLIVSGACTGMAPEISELKTLHEQVDLPVIIGSGMSSHNIHRYYHLADGFIVGSWFKENGNWENKVDPDRVKLFLSRVHSLST